jgi:hypothetical protein
MRVVYVSVFASFGKYQKIILSKVGMRWFRRVFFLSTSERPEYIYFLTRTFVYIGRYQDVCRAISIGRKCSAHTAVVVVELR